MDVQSADFANRVIERSRQVPVLVDFWASWCGPCRMLGPVLEKLAGEPQARFELAKVDIDANPDLAARYRVRSIPAVKLFIDGDVAGEFLGALPEPAVRRFLDQHIPSEADMLVGEAVRRLAAGDRAGAEKGFRAALAIDPGNGPANLALARLALTDGDEEAAAQYLDAASPRGTDVEELERLRQALELSRQCREAGGEQACRERLAADPGDLDARESLGKCLAAAGKYREALDELHEVVRADKHHNDGAARKAMLVIFGIVGVRSPLADEYRDRLAMLL